MIDKLPVKFNLLALILLAIIVVLLIWFIYGVCLGMIFNSLEDAANFGSSFGAVSSLFSGLAFIALVFTLILQYVSFRDLQYKNNVETFQRFYNMLVIEYDDIVSKLVAGKLEGSKVEVVGKRLFDIIQNKTKFRLSGYNGPQESKSIIDDYHYFYSFDDSLIRYLRHSNRLFKYIDESNLILHREKAFYMTHFSDKWSMHEREYILFHAFAGRENEAWLKYFKKYNLMNVMDGNDIGRSMNLSPYIWDFFDKSNDPEKA
ncbi:MAG: hypothetical protein MJA30_13495 [Cytophagales bacterium]|nr:hypothetical protein [Cytophagales bacterium]